MNSRPFSARSRTPSGRSNINTSRPSSPSIISNLTNEELKNLNEPLYVNRKYCGNDEPLTQRRVKPMLPPSRFPTVYNGPETPPKKKILSCPEGWIEKQKQIKGQIDNSIEGRNKVAKEFIDNNSDRMHEYKYEFQNKTPRSIQSIMVNTKEFGSLMNELAKKERARKIGTSSYQVIRCLNENGRKSVHEIPFDPSITSLSTSRSKREIQINRLFAPTIELHTKQKEFNRGLNHAQEYGNFSKYQGCLVLNQGTMLSR